MKDVISPDSPLPRRGGRLRQFFGRLVLRLLGWRIVGRLPDVKQAVLILAPHTSNWDGVVGVACLWALRLDVRFMAKHSLFRPPFANPLHWIGALPIRRDRAEGVVEQSVAYFRENERFVLGITPEGTRHGADTWKSGFYRIAEDAGVPIIVVAFDYGTNRVLIADTVEPSGDYELDLARILTNYEGVKARRMERLSGPLRKLIPSRRATD